MNVQCPTCGTTVEWSATQSPYRPFCSARCRLIDLGAWADESHRIPVGAEETDDLTELSGGIPPEYHH